MALIEARKRLDVTRLDISEQPESRFILMYHDMPFAVDDLVVDEKGVAIGVRGTGPDRATVMSFYAEQPDWFIVRRDAVRLATKEEVAQAGAELAQLHEDIFKKHRPDEFRAYEEQKARLLGRGEPDEGPAFRAGGYL